MPTVYNARDAGNYERLMGRWSRRLAPLFIEHAGIADGEEVLEVGCGTGDNCIYLAKHGWTVIGVDYVDSALVKARAKASVAKVEATFVRGDVTKLDSADVGDNFDLIVDYGCLHSLKGSDLEAYARAVTAVAAPTAQLTIMAFAPGALLGVPGVTSDEVGRLFADGWQQLSSVEETTTGRRGQTPGRSYLFERRV